MDYRVKRVLMESLPRGADLWESVRDLVVRTGVRAGAISLIGAVDCAVVGSWDQEARVYHRIGRTEELEIVSCTGNVSLKDGAPFPHLHAIFGARDGSTFGGHLMPGCRVYVAEVAVWELEGPPLERHTEPSTGLPLWRIP